MSGESLNSGSNEPDVSSIAKELGAQFVYFCNARKFGLDKQQLEAHLRRVFSGLEVSVAVADKFRGSSDGPRSRQWLVRVGPLQTLLPAPANEFRWYGEGWSEYIVDSPTETLVEPKSLRECQPAIVQGVGGEWKVEQSGRLAFLDGPLTGLAAKILEDESLRESAAAIGASTSNVSADEPQKPSILEDAGKPSSLDPSQSTSEKSGAGILIGALTDEGATFQSAKPKPTPPGLSPKLLFLCGLVTFFALFVLLRVSFPSSNNSSEAAPLPAAMTNSAEARGKLEAEAKRLAEAKARDEARLKAEAEAKAQAEARARTEAKKNEEARLAKEVETRRIATQKAQEESRLKAEATARAAEEKKQEEARLKEEAQKREEARLKAEAETKAQADAKAQAETKKIEEARIAKAKETEAQRSAEEARRKEAAELKRQAAEREARAKAAEAEAKRLAAEKALAAEIEQKRAQAEAEQKQAFILSGELKQMLASASTDQDLTAVTEKMARNKNLLDRRPEAASGLQDMLAEARKRVADLEERRQIEMRIQARRRSILNSIDTEFSAALASPGFVPFVREKMLERLDELERQHAGEFQGDSSLRTDIARLRRIITNKPSLKLNAQADRVK